jgi:hypothetical protein
MVEKIVTTIATSYFTLSFLFLFFDHNHSFYFSYPFLTLHIGIYSWLVVAPLQLTVYAIFYFYILVFVLF